MNVLAPETPGVELAASGSVRMKRSAIKQVIDYWNKLLPDSVVDAKQLRLSIRDHWLSIYSTKEVQHAIAMAIKKHVLSTKCRTTRRNQMSDAFEDVHRICYANRMRAIAPDPSSPGYLRSILRRRLTGPWGARSGVAQGYRDEVAFQALQDLRSSGVSGEDLTAIVKSAYSFPDFLERMRAARAAHLAVIHPNGEGDLNIEAACNGDDVESRPTHVEGC